MSGQQRWFDRPRPSADGRAERTTEAPFVRSKQVEEEPVRRRVGSCGMELFCLGAFTFCRAYRMSTMNLIHSLESYGLTQQNTDNVK